MCQRNTSAPVNRNDTEEEELPQFDFTTSYEGICCWEMCMVPIQDLPRTDKLCGSHYMDYYFYNKIPGWTK
ncbi:uncharacterized protein LOC62_04G005776 [Vanrija pseudolonga]|uniref:Uncharacterized protein n=1 Tax=Vanrija pseudolonga TaxID=143232 RepID=A0AAF0Y8X5_9TREE|nr:hypothetical protein LOC62_04G005776 [Vanrija pseudolonga]